MPSENHPFAVRAFICRFQTAKVAIFISEKHCRTDGLYENSVINDFRTQLSATMKFFTRMPDIRHARRQCFARNCAKKLGLKMNVQLTSLQEVFGRDTFQIPPNLV